jgi:hypothetical protein
MKRFARNFVGVIAVLAVVLLGFTPAAFAQEVTTSDVTYSSSAASSTVKTVERVSTSTKIELEHVSSVGVKRPKAKGCKLVSSWGKRPAGAKCFRLARYGKFVTKARNRAGTLVDLYTYVGAPTSSSPNAKWMMFLKRDGKWLKAGDQNDDGNCENPSRGPGNPPKLTWKVVQEFKSFMKAKWKVGLDLYEKGKVKAWATATCNTSGSAAWAEAEAWLRVRVYVYVYVKYSFRAKINGPGKVTQDMKQKVVIDVTAKGVLKIKASASAWCTDSEEQPPPPPPPAVNHPPQVEMQDLFHVETGKSVGIEGCARDEDGDTLTVPTPTVSPSSLGRIDGWRRLDPGEPTTCQPGWTAFEGTFQAASQPTWPDNHEEVATITMTATDPGNLSGTATEDIRVRKVVHPDT